MLYLKLNNCSPRVESWGHQQGHGLKRLNKIPINKENKTLLGGINNIETKVSETRIKERASNLSRARRHARNEVIQNKTKLQDLRFI